MTHTPIIASCKPEIFLTEQKPVYWDNAAALKMVAGFCWKMPYRKPGSRNEDKAGFLLDSKNAAVTSA